MAGASCGYVTELLEEYPVGYKLARLEFPMLRVQTFTRNGVLSALL